VVARDQIFLGIAVSQASALGIALAIWLGGLGGAVGAALEGGESDTLATGLAVLASVGTAVFTSRSRGQGQESAEAVTGWVFLFAASVPVLLLAHSPHGLEEIHHLMFSTLLGANESDLLVLGALAVVTVALAARLHARLLLLAVDPEMAVAVGVRRARALAAVAAWLGLCVGLSMRVSGMLYTFGCLVLPALVAKNLSREITPLFWLAPGVALLASGVGFVLAHHFDVPPAHATVALLSAALLAAWGVRRRRA
jgi:ABC-type Mn2+/Zn2+ transport system permease subunit